MQKNNTTELSMSLDELWCRIIWLPVDTRVLNAPTTSSKQQVKWVGWLDEYDTPGYYKRKGGEDRDAEYAYNHLQNPDMLLWLGDAAGLPETTVSAAIDAYKAAKPILSSQCAAIRKEMPWALVQSALRKIEITNEQTEQCRDKADKMLGIK